MAKILDQTNIGLVHENTVAYGTGNLKKGNETYSGVKLALSLGYYVIDTASYYENEADVGKAIFDSGIDRKKLFIITKLSHGNKSPVSIMAEFNQSLELLDVDYVDLYLIHAPWKWQDKGKNFRTENLLTWNTLIRIKESGKAKYIGVSNFDIFHLEYLIANSNEIPAVNQIPVFIGNASTEIVNYCKKNGIFVQSSSPLATGNLIFDENIEIIARSLGVSNAQLALKYCLSKGIMPVVRSISKKHLIENLCMNFCLNQNLIAILDGIENDPRVWS